MNFKLLLLLLLLLLLRATATSDATTPKVNLLFCIP